MADEQLGVIGLGVPGNSKWRDNGQMTRRKWILLGLLLAVVGVMVGIYFFWPGEIQAAVGIFVAFGVLAANGWEWLGKGSHPTTHDWGMTLRRGLLLELLAAVIGMMLLVYFFWNGELQATVVLILAVLVVAANAWEWITPVLGIQGEMDRKFIRRMLLLLLALVAVGMVLVALDSQAEKAVSFLCVLFAIPVLGLNLWEAFRGHLAEPQSFSRRRLILLILLALAVLAACVYAFWPQQWLEYVCLLFGLPVILANAWEWFLPHLMEEMVNIIKGQKKASKSHLPSQEGGEEPKRSQG
jgi:hypothetical protein